jgi:hypothetical protein
MAGELFRTSQSSGESFPDAKLREKRIENLFHVGVPDDFPDGVECSAQINRHQLRRETLQERLARLIAGCECASQTVAVARIDRDCA